VVFIVAECGVNFTMFAEAVAMMIEAKSAGVDAVKFQIYNHDNLCKVYGGDVERNPNYDELIEIRLDESRMRLLKDQADKIGIEIFATPMYLEAVNMLERVGVERYKIRYADRFNNDLLAAVQATGKPILISCDQEFIWKKPDIIDDNLDQFTLMYCIPEYPPDPTKFKEMVKAFQSVLEEHVEKHDLKITNIKGYSNHYPSIIPPLMTAARGAEVIEVHVKLNGTHPLDDAVSIDMTELAELCRLIRQMEEYL